MVKPTSVKAYRELVKSGKAKTQRDHIFNYLVRYSDNGMCLCRTQLEQITGYTINAVCGRVNELLEMNMIEVFWTAESPATGKTVEFLGARG